MGPVHIIFVIGTLAVPSWIWLRGDDGPKVNWKTFQMSMTRIVNAQPDFQGCSATDFVEALRDLCRNSGGRLNGEAAVVVERLTADAALRCEVKPKSFSVQWLTQTRVPAAVDAEPEDVLAAEDEIGETPAPPPASAEDDEDKYEAPKLPCVLGSALKYEPAFTFNLNGQLQSLSFKSSSGARQAVPVKNCRRKLKQANELDPVPARETELITALGRLPEDPQDFQSANAVCLHFDVAAQWSAWRERYQETLQ